MGVVSVASELSLLPVIDNHCHAVLSSTPIAVDRWRPLFSESPDPVMRASAAADTAFYRRLMRELGGFLGVASDETSVLRARARLGTDNLVAELFADARIAGVVIDTGFPAAGEAMDRGQFTSLTGTAYRGLLRLELMFQELVAATGRYDELVPALRRDLADVRGAGFAGFKSIVGYRTGLDVQQWTDDDARSAFAAARHEVEQTGSVRLGHKPLLDTLLHAAFAIAAEQELPVQFHVGYGDPDVDLRKAGPLQLRAVLENPAYRAMPIVLLHGCWPFVREGAYLASVYGNVHLDLSYAIPFLSLGELTAMTRAALSVAPFGKLMYSSDGVRVPELHWMGARTGRRCLATALDELVSDGDLDRAEALEVAERILAGNAAALYGFGALLPGGAR
jgi:predicted TIM-barrel fold metal-dependent hydrolase